MMTSPHRSTSFELDVIENGTVPERRPEQVVFPAHSNSDRGSIFSSGSDGAPKPAVDQRAMRMFSRDCLDRQLRRHHITAIAFSGTVGAGLFSTSGEMVGISGAAGGPISYAVAGLIVTCIMRSLAELVAFRPVAGALIDFPATFVDDALGFAVGVTYTLGQCMSMATLTAIAASLADNFGPDFTLSRSQKAGIIVGLVLLTTISNICGVKTYGRLERAVKWLKISLLLLVSGLSIYVSVHEGLNSYRDHPLAPQLVFANRNGAEIDDNNTSLTTISGSTGQFLGIWTSTVIAIFACMGGDIVIVTAGEAKSPRNDLPPATRFMYLLPIFFYIFCSFLSGFNVNHLEKQMLIPWIRDNPNGYHSPYIVAVLKTGLRVLPNFLNAAFMFCSYSAGNTALFTSSRTLFAMARIYGNDFIKNTLGRTNNGQTPVAAILVCSLFGLLAFIGVGTAGATYNQPILTLTAVFTGGVGCVYAAECVAFLRFQGGLRKSEKRGTLSRDEPVYYRRYYRAHWQPLCAIIGLVGIVAIVVTSPWQVLYLLTHGDNINTGNFHIKDRESLAWDVVGAYAGPILFIGLYLGYRFIYGTKFKKFDDFKGVFEEGYMQRFNENERIDGEEIYELKLGTKGVLKEAWSLIK